MRVLFVVPDLFGHPGGIARYCSLVARVLDRSPAIERLDVLALRDAPDTNVDGHYLSSARFTHRGFGGDRVALSQAVLKQRWRGRYDLLLSGHVNLTPLLGVPLPGRRTARQVTFVYGTDVWSPLPWLRNRSLRAQDTVIAISQFTAARAIAANRLAPERVCVLPNCLDPAFEPARLRPPGPPAGNVILTVSRLSKLESGKGHGTVLRALPRVLEVVPDVAYHVVGEGDLRPDLERLAADLGIADRVHFFGRVSDAEVDQSYARCRAFVMPSRYEGFGFVFLEAMAHGRPIVAGNRDASGEVIGDAGILVDPDEPEDVAQAVVEVLTNQTAWSRLAANARRRLNTFLYEQFEARLYGALALGPAPPSRAMDVMSEARGPSGSVSHD